MRFDPSDRDDLLLHFEKHGADLNAHSPEEYEAMAERFMTSVPTETTLECLRRRPMPPMLCRYSTATDEYGVMRQGAYLVTHFILKFEQHRFPTNLDYYYHRCR